MRQDYFTALLDNDRRWWEYFSPSPVRPDPIQTEYTCAAILGHPSTANCGIALSQMILSGPITLDPATGPLIQRVGNCAIGIESTSKQTTMWEIIRGIAETLFTACMSNPVSSASGGYATSHAIINGHSRTGSPKRQAESASQALNFTVSMYLQDPFNGPPSSTCAWEVASSHVGDVRQCPAPTGPWRPPERRLGDNATSFGEWRQGNVTEVKIGNSTLIIDGNLTALIKNAHSKKGQQR